VTTTATATKTAVTTEVSEVRTTSTKTVTATPKPTGLPNEVLTCASLTGMYNHLQTEYIEKISDGEMLISDLPQVGTAVGAIVEAQRITANRLDESPAKDAWLAAVAEGHDAATELEGGGDPDKSIEQLTKYMAKAASAMDACTTAMG